MMNVNLVDMVKGYLSPDIIKKCGVQLGETPEATQRGLNSAIPTVMGGFVRQASSDPTGAGVARILTEGQRDGEKLEDLSSMMAGGPKTEALLSKSQGMLGGLFGDRLSSAVDNVASSSGLSQRSAGKILAIAAPIVGAVVGREAGARKLNPAGLASMLVGQKSAVASALGSSGISNVFGGAGDWTATETHAAQPSHVERAAEPIRQRLVTPEGRPAGRRIGMPFILLGALALLGLLFLFGRRKEPISTTTPEMPRAVPRAEAPRAPATPPPIGGGPSAAVSELNQFFTNTNEMTPKRIPLQGMTFEKDSDRLTPTSARSLDGIAATLQAHPSANIRVEGYTDDSGNADFDRELSADRANAVRDVLIRDGVSPQRITVTGNGSANPIAPNTTDQGRAANRRIEIVVTNR